MAEETASSNGVDQQSMGSIKNNPFLQGTAVKVTYIPIIMYNIPSFNLLHNTQSFKRSTKQRSEQIKESKKGRISDVIEKFKAHQDKLDEDRAKKGIPAKLDIYGTNPEPFVNPYQVLSDTYVVSTHCLCVSAETK